MRYNLYILWWLNRSLSTFGRFKCRFSSPLGHPPTCKLCHVTSALTDEGRKSTTCTAAITSGMCPGQDNLTETIHLQDVFDFFSFSYLCHLNARESCLLSYLTYSYRKMVSCLLHTGIMTNWTKESSRNSSKWFICNENKNNNTCSKKHKLYRERFCRTLFLLTFLSNLIINFMSVCQFFVLKYRKV